MKAKLVWICFLCLVTFGLSSCFVKKWFTQERHYNDHRGYYPEMGLTPKQMEVVEKKRMEQEKKRRAHEAHKKSKSKKGRHKKHKDDDSDSKDNAQPNPVTPADTSALKNIVDHAPPPVTKDSLGAPKDTATHKIQTDPKPWGAPPDEVAPVVKPVPADNPSPNAETPATQPQDPAATPAEPQKQDSTPVKKPKKKPAKKKVTN